MRWLQAFVLKPCDCFFWNGSQTMPIGISLLANLTLKFALLIQYK